MTAILCLRASSRTIHPRNVYEMLSFQNERMPDLLEVREKAAVSALSRDAQTVYDRSACRHRCPASLPAHAAEPLHLKRADFGESGHGFTQSPCLRDTIDCLLRTRCPSTNRRSTHSFSPTRRTSSMRVSLGISCSSLLSSRSLGS